MTLIVPNPVYLEAGYYEKILKGTPNARNFENALGTYERLGGIAAPGFSLYTTNRPIASYREQKLMIDFCSKTNSAIFQKTPENCTGTKNTPYAAESGFALDAIYLSIEDLRGIGNNGVLQVDEKLLSKVPIKTEFDGTTRVNYDVKNLILNLALKHFKSRSYESWRNDKAFQNFLNVKSSYWMDGYVAFRVLKELHNKAGWETWGNQYQIYSSQDKQRILRELESNPVTRERVNFHRWLQWQLFEGAVDLKSYAARKNVRVMIDLPFLVSRDSADVWEHAHEGYFILNYQVGAKPDAYFADGQLWGIPLPNFKKNEAYILEKRRYASNFGHLERKDHEIGQHRTYVNRLDARDGKNGFFIPEGKEGDEISERNWELHGDTLERLQMEDPLSNMVYTAEGLGTPPKYMRERLRKNGIPDIDLARWTKEGPVFVTPREIAVLTQSTHDSRQQGGWWRYDAGTIDHSMFENLCKDADVAPDKLIDLLFEKPDNSGRLRWKKGLDVQESALRAVAGLIDEYKNTIDEKGRFLQYIGMDAEPGVEVTPEMVRLVLKNGAASCALFHIPTIYDVLSMREEGLMQAVRNRPNTPGIFDPAINWNWRAQKPLDKMCEDNEIIEALKSINHESRRLLPS